MNKVFKVVFSKAKGMFVVGSEYISSNGKKSVKAVVAVAMMAGAMGLAGNAGAATIPPIIGDITIDDTTALMQNETIGQDGSTVSIVGNSSAAENAGKSAFRVEDNNTYNIKGQDITIKSSFRGVNTRGGRGGDTFSPKVIIGGENTEKVDIRSTASSGDGANVGGVIAQYPSSIKIQAKDIYISGPDFAVLAMNATETAVAPDGAASVSIIGDTITLESSNGVGVSAFSNGQVTIDGDLTVNAENVIDARGNSTVNINTDGHHKTVLNGDIVFETPNMPSDAKSSGKIINAKVNVVLNGSDSVWTGKAYQAYDNGTSVELEATPYHGNVTGFNVKLSDGAVWNATGNSFVNDLEVENATVNISDEAEKLNITNLAVDDAIINVAGQNAQIKTGTLEGKATVNLATESNGNDDFTAGTLKAGNADGANLKVNYTGISADDVNNSQEAMKALSGHVQTPGASVTNNVAEGDVSGAMTWSSTTEDGQAVISNVSEAKNSVVTALNDIGSNTFLFFRSQMNDLDKRMGDLRTMPNTDGAWARVIAGQSQYKSSHNTYQTLQVGADHRIGNFVLGGMASYTDGDGTQKNGSTDDKAYSFGLYGAWLNDDGQFVDVTVKRYHAESDYDLRYTDGRKAKGSLDTSGTSISAEYGWRLGIEGTNYYVEPQVEFMYGHMNSFGYKTSNGVKVKQDAIKTAVGRVGVAAGWVDPNKAGSAYIKVSVLNDWEGDSYSKASKSGISRKNHEDMGGTWVEYALGGTYNLSKNLSIYGEAETTSGSPVRTTYQFSAGMRYSF